MISDDKPMTVNVLTNNLKGFMWMSFHNYIAIPKETNLTKKSYCNATVNGWHKQFVIVQAIIISILVKLQKSNIDNAVFFFKNRTIGYAFL